METPLISIIIPVYNWEKYIKRCVDSIIKQTYKNIEIITINDWSTDNTLNILNSYKQDCIKVINQKNMGLWPTRNVWIKNATGDYVLFVDADDFLKEDCLETYVKELNKWDYDIIIWWYYKFDWKNYKKVNLKWDLFSQYNHTEPWNRIYKRDFLSENWILFWNLRSNEDLLFWLETYSKTDNIKFIDDSWYIYFIENQESITKTMHKHFFEDFWKALKCCCELEDNNKRNKIYAQYKIVKSAIVYLIFCGRHETSSNFMKEYSKHFKLMKSHFNIYITRFVFKESLLFNFVVLWFLFFDKFHLVKLFSKIYCVWNK